MSYPCFKMSKYILGIGASLLTSGCGDFDEPESLDPIAIIGCYTAAGAPSIKVTQNNVVIAGRPPAYGYKYEQRKVGMILRLPLTARTVDGQITFQESVDHLYRVVHTDAGPVIRVVVSPDASLVNYRRQPSEGCN